MRKSSTGKGLPPRSPPLETAGLRTPPPSGMRYEFKVPRHLLDATYLEEPFLWLMIDSLGRCVIAEEVIKNAGAELRRRDLELQKTDTPF